MGSENVDKRVVMGAKINSKSRGELNPVIIGDHVISLKPLIRKVVLSPLSELE